MVEFELKDLISTYSKTLKLPIIHDKPNRGTISIKYEVNSLLLFIIYYLLKNIFYILIY
jgi:hypothetical protein